MADYSTGWAPPNLPGQQPATSPAAQPPGPGQDFDFGAWLEQNPTMAFWGTAFSILGGDVHDSLSWLGNVFSASPEQQLAEQIFKKMGPGEHPSGGLRGGPDPNYMRALAAAHAAMNDPNYRQQLAVAMGWNVQNPQVMTWLQHGGMPPQNPTAAAPGQTTGGTTAPGSTGATSGYPFDPKAYKGRAGDPGFTYGAVLPPDIAAAAGVAQQWGVDYALPLGTALPTPFAGVIKEADFNGPYGNTVVVQLSNGYTYRVAHLLNMNVQVGQQVGIGTQLGSVGSTGNSTGPHVLIEMHDSSNKPIDPTPIIDSLLTGDFSGASKILEDYHSSDTLNSPFKTPDGHLVYPQSEAGAVYAATQAMWRKRYGGDPPWTFVSGLIANGNTTTEQIQSVMDQQSSDIPSMNWGQRDQLTSDANKVAAQAWSRPLPDKTIKQLAGEGITTPAQLQAWVNSHPASAVDNADYTAIYDGLNVQTQKYWQQPPSPDMVAEIHRRMQQGPQ